MPWDILFSKYILSSAVATLPNEGNCRQMQRNKTDYISLKT